MVHPDLRLVESSTASHMGMMLQQHEHKTKVALPPEAREVHSFGETKKFDSKTPLASCCD
eukprot:239568-Amphidinium_carterae.1